MSLANWHHDATPEEAAAYKLGQADARRTLRIYTQRVLEYELALNKIRSAPTNIEADEIATAALARHKATT